MQEPFVVRQGPGAAPHYERLFDKLRVWSAAYLHLHDEEPGRGWVPAVVSWRERAFKSIAPLPGGRRFAACSHMPPAQLAPMCPGQALHIVLSSNEV